MRLLIIEDELALQQQLAEQLKEDGFAVDTASDGRDGLFMGEEYNYDLAIIDIGLPIMTGIEVIKQLRHNDRNFPIMILTARGAWQEKVEGLEAGADDYLVKPFHMEELRARVQALLRRAQGSASNLVDYGPITLDTSAKTVTLNGTPVELTSYEYNTFEYLAVNSHKVISKIELTEHLYDQDFDRDSNVLEVFVMRLRKKLDPEGTISPISTVRGQGYRFNLQKISNDSE